MAELFELTWNDAPEVYAAYVNGRDFRNVDLRNVCFGDYANEPVNLEGADFRGCDLSSTEFCYCNLVNADFTGANLEGCEFIDCYFGDAPVLKGAENIRARKPKSCHYSEDLYLYNIFNITMPLDTVGQELIVYKFLMARNSDEEFEVAIAKLLVPAEAKRIVFKGSKCRCEKARVLDIYSIDKTRHFAYGFSCMYDRHFKYTVGEEVCADKFDEDAKLICAHGIHFFLTEEEAVEYSEEF